MIFCDLHLSAEDIDQHRLPIFRALTITKSHALLLRHTKNVYTMFGPLHEGTSHWQCDPATNAPIDEKLTTLYKSPSSHTQLQISVRYRFNEMIPSALENRLLLLPSDKGEDWEAKKEIVLPLAYKILASGEHRIWLTVTGLEFHTTNNGDIEWRSYEDVGQSVPRIPASEVPAGVKKIDVSELTNVALRAWWSIPPNTTIKYTL